MVYLKGLGEIAGLPDAYDGFRKAMNNQVQHFQFPLRQWFGQRLGQNRRRAYRLYCSINLLIHGPRR